MSAMSNRPDQVLVIDGDADLQGLVASTLQQAGYHTPVAGDGPEGLRAFFQTRPDLVVLDVVLPGMSGWELCQRIREVAETPIVILSALGGEDNKVKGLAAGADDYVLKPFSSRELVARIGAILRRTHATPPGEEEAYYADARLMLDYRLHEARVDGQRIALSPMEYRLLAYLVRNRNQVLTPDQLLERVWGDESESFGSLKQYISRLRRKLGDDAAHPQVIATVRAIGYRYVRQETADQGLRDTESIDTRQQARSELAQPERADAQEWGALSRRGHLPGGRRRRSSGRTVAAPGYQRTA